MKKIYLSLLILFMIIPCTFAAGGTDDLDENLLGTNLNITTYTSEECGVSGEGTSVCTGSGQTLRCKCTISASDGFVTFISSIYKYIFFIALVLGVLLMVILGIGMSLSGVASEEMKTMAKSKIMDIFIGLLALAMVPWILKTIAPYFFT